MDMYQKYNNKTDKMEQILGCGRIQQDETPEHIAIKKVLKKYGSPQELSKFYTLVRHDERIKVGEFTFYTIDETNEVYESMTHDDIGEVVSTLRIGYRYIGMGNMCSLMYDPRIRKYYFRHDGGCNDWERTSLYEYFENPKFDPTDQKYETKVFEFDDALRHVVKNTYCDFMITMP